MLVLVTAWSMLTGCVGFPEADQDLSEAAVTAFRDFDQEDERVAVILRNLEREIYTDLRVDAEDPGLRSVAQTRLTFDDVEALGLKHDRDPQDAMSALMAYASPHSVHEHSMIPVQADQRPLEPQSPDHYERQFRSEPACWPDRGCLWLETYQELTKSYPLNIIPPLEYAFGKEFRWVDMALPGEEPRWAVFARTFTDREYLSDGDGNQLLQSYTFEVWMPRDGRGFRFDDRTDAEGEPLPEDQGDSRGKGTLRLNALWTETVIFGGVDPAIQESAIRGGMNDNFKTHDAWLDEHTR